MESSGFDLLPMRTFDGLDKHIKSTRTDILPSDAVLRKLRDRADSAGISGIDLDELTIELEGESDSFWLEHGSTGIRVGCVGINTRINYRFLWLIDGRTMEIVNDRKTDNAVIFSDGNSVGLFMAQEQESFLKVLRVCVSWRIIIDDTLIFRARFSNREMRAMELIRHQASDAHVWVSKPGQAKITDYLQYISHRVFKTKSPLNDRWFLPRFEGQPLHRNDSERLALLAFALQFRQAFWSLGD